MFLKKIIGTVVYSLFFLSFISLFFSVFFFLSLWILVSFSLFIHFSLYFFFKTFIPLFWNYVYVEVKTELKTIWYVTEKNDFKALMVSTITIKIFWVLHTFLWMFLLHFDIIYSLLQYFSHFWKLQIYTFLPSCF